ncbi:TlpA family protein disulfide reductase [Candidatus Planktophila dulcis]|uniref:TlpA family protein disulfide reductase n=1 Tax=Candidatus Planktophila dulcis TaxID=1884914 RepID=UPI003CF216A9
MKKLLVIALSVITLTGCSLTQPIPVKGEVVSCADIKTVASEGVALDCLDGSKGVVADSIVGPALINVWGTWCAPCRQELPHFAHYLAKHDSVRIIGIAVEEKNMAVVRKFVESNGMSWPILYDADGSTRGKFGMGVPVTWFIDASGKVVHKKYGPFKSLEEIELSVIKYLGVK